MNARKSGHERTKVWLTHESLMNARKFGHERTKVWLTHESLDIGTFRLGRSGHIDFLSGSSTWEELKQFWGQFVLSIAAFLINKFPQRNLSQIFREI